MRGIKILGVAIFVVGFFVFMKSFVWGAGSVVINEFVFNPASGNEWVEIYNGTDGEIDLGNYKIFDSGNSGKSTSGTVAAGDWGVFSWGGSYLNNDADSVILKNEDTELDKVVYSGKTTADKGYSMARLIDGDINSGWEMTPSTTPGAANIFPSPVEDEGEPTTTVFTDWSKIKINEFVSDPADGNEWVEFYNSATTSADLAGGLVCDNREVGAGCLDLSGVILAGGWLQFDLNTKSFLNNGGDSVLLKNNLGEEMDRVDYDDLAPDKGNSLARKIDGEDTGNLTDWAETVLTTPGAQNIIEAPAQNSDHGSSKKETEDDSLNEAGFFDATSTYYGKIVFNEVLPDPAGNENEEEFLEIKNLSAYVLDLEGWTLVVSDKQYKLSDLLFVGRIRAFKRADLGFALNNSGDKIRLYDSGGYLAAELEYGKIKTGMSFARRDSGEWAETSVPTPEAENIFLIDDGVSILWRLTAPDSVSIGETAEFFVGDSLDPRGGDLFFSWRVGEVIYSGEKLSLVFEETGNYEIEITATGTAGTIGKKVFNLAVGAGRSDNDFGIGLSEVCPDPRDGQENEFVEIYNYGLAETDLSSWRLRYDGREYIFPEGTIAEPDEYLIFYRPISKFNLADTDGSVDLLDAERRMLDRVQYVDLQKGECAVLVGGLWQNSVSSTPRAANIYTARQIKKDEVKIKKTTSVKKTKVSASAKQAVLGMKEFSIAEARNQEKGVPVKITGVVAVLPGVFGTQYFYIFDGAAGIQIYQNKKIFPDLRVGDKIEISGEVSESSGRKRVNVKSIEGFDILSVEEKVSPLEIKANETEDFMFGSFVSASGEITELKSGFMYLDDGTGEFAVYFKPGAKINKKNYQEGMRVKVFGVFERGSNGAQIWPRGEQDIETIFTPTSEEPEYIMSIDDHEKSWFEEYFSAAFGGLTAVAAGFLIRTKGSVFRQGAKKVASLISRAMGKK